MIIKIGKFNFLSENKEEFRLSQYDLISKFDYFYMDGKEDTLYVNSRSDFDKENKEYYKYKELNSIFLLSLRNYEAKVQ